MNKTENLINKNNYNYMISTTNTKSQEMQIETSKKAKLLHKRVSIKSRRRCVVCSKPDKRSDVKNECSVCKMVLYPGKCFCDYN